MERFPTNLIEKVYEVLCKYAEANPNRYEREAFIYHYGVKTGMRTYILNTIDSRPRRVIREGNHIFLQGKGESVVNSIIKKLIESSGI